MNAVQNTGGDPSSSSTGQQYPQQPQFQAGSQYANFGGGQPSAIAPPGFQNGGNVQGQTVLQGQQPVQQQQNGVNLVSGMQMPTAPLSGFGAYIQGAAQAQNNPTGTGQGFRRGQ